MLSREKGSQFETLVRAYSAELYRYAYWLCRDCFMAEDLVQETFARAWQSWEGLRDDKAAKSWLYTILRNERARSFERKRFDIDDAVELDGLIDHTSAGPHEEIEMRQMLGALPRGYREPLVLQVLGGYSCAEIAKIMDISEGAVMTRLTRARLALRNLPGVVAAREAKSL
jgi:RNA polymerase sigma-70 factor (ECF subfamily)